jgi:hypothetical protein
MKQHIPNPAPRRFDVLSIFIGTSLVAAIGVPWYGITHGYHPGLWLTFVLLLGWNGLSITSAALWPCKIPFVNGALITAPTIVTPMIVTLTRTHRSGAYGTPISAGC